MELSWICGLLFTFTRVDINETIMNFGMDVYFYTCSYKRNYREFLVWRLHDLFIWTTQECCGYYYVMNHNNDLCAHMKMDWTQKHVVEVLKCCMIHLFFSMNRLLFFRCYWSQTIVLVAGSEIGRSGRVWAYKEVPMKAKSTPREPRDHESQETQEHATSA